MPQTSSVYDGKVAANFVTLSQANWIDEGHVISPTQGIQLYGQFCADCHGDQGQGDGPGTAGSPSGAPAAFTDGMSEAYIFWRVWDGVPDSVMPPFAALMATGDLSEAGIWDIIAYISTFPGQGGGP
jgi:mono/diheme cytochrome c family protein